MNSSSISGVSKTTKATLDVAFLFHYFQLIVIGAILVWILRIINRKLASSETSSVFVKYLDALVQWFAIGKINPSGRKEATSHERNRFVFRIFCHFLTINAAYITWGIIQERIMTIEYRNEQKNLTEKFQQSEFIVLSNRAFSVVVSAIFLYLFNFYSNAQNPENRSFPPFYEYSYATLSNLISSWCQYEALKYVSFPLQVLAKSCKVVPVMIVGTFISRKVYPLRQYMSAFGLTLGICLFTFSTITNKSSDKKIEAGDRGLGFLLLVFYLLGDSFTSNWQSELYRRYSINSFQMMFNCSLISVIFMTYSFSVTGFSYAAAFIRNHPAFLFHLMLCSLCSSIGQVFIFYAIKDVGPVVFTGIMVTRSLISMLASCIIYHHAIPPLGICGLLVIFGILYLEFWYNLKNRN